MDGHRILVVDDEPLNVEYLRQELTDRGFEVETAFNGVDALARVEVSPPHLILLDVVMPGIDGIEVCQRLKSDERTRLIPVVIMTALSDDESRILGVEAGADDYLTKPVDDRELFARMRNALRLKDALDRHAEELRTAAEQISHLGKHDEEVAVVVAVGGDAFSRDQFEAEMLSHGAVTGLTASTTPAAAFRGTEPAESARTALRSALALGESGLALGVSVGSALMGAERRDVGVGHEWVISVDGPAAAEAKLAADSSIPGRVLAGRSVVELVGSSFGAERFSEVGSKQLFDMSAPPSAAQTGRFEIDFPSEFDPLLPVLSEEWKISDIYATRSLSGKSGARVLVVDITMDGFSGQGILKLEIVDDVTGPDELEAERHRQAIEMGGRYAVERLPRLVRHIAVGEMTATLSTVAAGGLEYCQAWFRMPYELQLASAERISNDILEGWNTGYVLEPGLVSPGEILRRWLTYRLDPEVGRLDLVMSEMLGVDPHTPSLFVDGVWYPNPLAFARDTGHIAEVPALRAAVGQMHGDLHGYNILTSQRRTDVSDYYLIDLAHYQHENYLFFDHGYLELSYLLRTREDASPSRWLGLLEGVFGGQMTEADDIGAIRIVEALRAGQHRWVVDHEEHRAGYMATQMLLGQIGAGLNFTHKRISDQRKKQSLLYASAALRELIALNDIDWPRTGEMASLD